MKLFSNVVVIFIVMIIAFIIIPLPAFFLDFMFIVSISASLIILLINIKPTMMTTMLIMSRL
jgi:flagellar biosynthesis protein FlhA